MKSRRGSQTGEMGGVDFDFLMKFHDKTYYKNDVVDTQPEGIGIVIPSLHEFQTDETQLQA